jgi:hypothetical protein
MECRDLSKRRRAFHDFVDEAPHQTEGVPAGLRPRHQDLEHMEHPGEFLGVCRYAGIA